MKKRMLSLITTVCLLCALLPALPASAAANINIGDYVQLGTYYGEPILWRCVDKDANGPLMLSDKIISIKPFDAGGTYTAAGSHSRNSIRSSGGSNYWADSNMRSWLNSEASAGNVNWLCGNPPSKDYVWNGYNAYDGEAGFLSGFSQGEKNAIKEVTQKSLVSYPEYDNNIYTSGIEPHNWNYYIDSVVQNYDRAYAEQVTDKMFLLDVKQVNAVYNNRDILGDDYYIGEPTAKAVENSEYKYRGLATGKKWYYWLRSPYATSHGTVRCVYSGGGVGDNSAYSYGIGVRPAFYLNLPAFSIQSGNGSASAPYIGYGSGGGTVSGGGSMPADINNVTINYKGTAYGYFEVKDTNGDAAANTKMSYTIDGGSAKTGVTDGNGYLCVKIEGVTKSRDYNVAISGNGVQANSGTISVTVTPLEFSSSYDATLTKGASAALGIGVRGSIGKLEAEAQAAEIGVSGSNKKGFSFSQERKDGKTKLTVAAKENYEAAIKAKAGLWAGASAGSAGLEISAGDIHGNAKYGNTMSVGFEDDDFHWNDSSDMTRFSKFMAGVLLENMDSNVAIRWLADKLLVSGDTYEKGSTAAIGAGASIGSVKMKKGDKDIGGVTLGGIDASAVWSQSTKTAKDNAVSRKSSVAADAGFKLLDVSLKAKDGNSSVSGGTAAWSKKLINNKAEFSAASDKNGDLTSLGITYTDDSNNDIFWFKSSESNKRTIKYSGDAAKRVAASYSELNDFALGDKGFFSALQMKRASEVMTTSGEKGEFSAQTTKTKGIDINASASVQLFLKLGGEIGISGAEGYSYEMENGIYQNNTVYTQAKNDIESKVAEEFFGIEDAFSLAAGYISNMIAGYWDTISGWIDSAAGAVVDTGKAAVKKTKETMTGWKVSITTAIDSLSPFSVMAVDSEFALFSTSSVATTIGNPYIVSVEDEDGAEITDFGENALLLTIEYTDEDLAEAEVEDMDDVSIYRWNEDKCVYVCMGGTLDEANKAMSLEITKPGQYILAADNCPPAVTEFMASDGGSSPEISAIVSDMSGIDDFTFSIDGDVLVNSDNLDDYYDHTTAQFVYPTSGLSSGEHTAVIYASDTAGNELTDGMILGFGVNTDAPVISNVTGLDEEISGSVTVSAEVESENLSAVYLNIEEAGMGRSARSSYEMTEENGVYSASVEDITESGQLRVWVSAYDINGNEGKSEERTIIYIAANDADKPYTVYDITVENGRANAAILAADDAPAGKLIAAAYDSDGVLTDIAIEDVTADSKNVDVSIDTDNAGTISAYIWDLLNGMKPLAQKKEITLE